jgi:hypothetical protein
MAFCRTEVVLRCKKFGFFIRIVRIGLLVMMRLSLRSAHLAAPVIMVARMTKMRQPQLLSIVAGRSLFMAER